MSHPEFEPKRLEYPKCVDCGKLPMPGALRCLHCFHNWMEATKGPLWGTSRNPTVNPARTPVRTVHVGGYQ